MRSRHTPLPLMDPTRAEQEPIDAIRGYIARNYRDGRTAGLEEDTPLVTSGIVDSAGILQLVDWLEERFGIRVDDEDVTLENFDSLAGLAGLVSRARS